MKGTVLVPPDGGYGWVIVFATALNNFITIPLMQNTGLIFRQKFALLGFSATEEAFIVTINSAFGTLMGLVNGILLNRFGYRKVSIMGAILIFVGILLTSFCHTFVGFLLTYGLITSLGIGMNLSSFMLAVNTYFTEKKNRAIGLSMTITALGPILMPQIVKALEENFDSDGETLILAGISLHTFVAALLLQPVKRFSHREFVEIDEAEELGQEDNDADKSEDEAPDVASPLMIARNRSSFDPRRFRRKDSAMTINYEQETGGIVGLDSTLGASMYSLEAMPVGRYQQYPSSPLKRNSQIKTQWWASKSSIHLSSCMDLYQIDNQFDDTPTKHSKECVWKMYIRSFCREAAEMIDIDLLKDPVYVNILLGMSTAIFTEVYFSVWTPFILADYGLDLSETASFLSYLGITDIICRFLAPYVGDMLKQPPRVMLIIALVGLISTRFALFLVSNRLSQILIAIALGIGKGVRIVYMSLIIPTYVPIERLAAASGMQMMVNGILLIIGGPILGILRDTTGSYNSCILVLNCFSLTTIMIWSFEMVMTVFMKNSVAVDKKLAE